MPEALTPDIEARFRWATDVAAETGQLLLSSFRSRVAAKRKERGVVTELDHEAERLVAASLREAFPDDGLLAEEGTGREGAGAFRWLVDPLDGTTNYVAGLPMFTVSLACIAGEDPTAALGVVHAPALGETFATVRGGGFADGGEAEGAATELQDAVFIVNKAYRPAATLWSVAGVLMDSVRAFRTYGCVSLDLALVAAGRADGLVLLPADPWDVAAGLLLVAEAGLQAGDLAGQPAPDGRRGILATRPALFGLAAGLIDPSPLAG